MYTQSASGGLRSHRWLLLIVGIVVFWIYVYGMATNPLKWEEPRRCIVAMEMAEGGNYIVPQIMGEPYLRKPPLQNWLIVLAAGNDPQRVGALSIRLISLFALAGLCAALWRLGTSAVGQPAVLPALVLSTMGLVMQLGRAGDVDMLFTFFVFGALACFELGRRKNLPWMQWFVPQLLVALGFLTKLIAPLLFYPPVLYLVWKRRGSLRFAPVPFGLGLLAAAMVLAAWLVPYAAQQPIDVLAQSWMTEVRARTLDLGAIAALRHLLLYPLLLLAWTLPWSLQLIGLRREPWREVSERLRRDPWLGLCAASAVWCALVFLFVTEHKARYLLPAVPGVSVLIATYLQVAAVQRAARPATRAVRRWAPWLVAAAVWSGLVVGFATKAPWPAPAATPLALGLLVLGSFAYANVKERVAVPLLLITALIYGVAYAGFAELREAERGRRLEDAAAGIAEAIREDVPIVCHKDVDLRFAYALSRLVGHPLVRDAGSASSTYWVADVRTQAGQLGSPLAATDPYVVWKVDGPEAWSLLGAPLFPPPLVPEVRVRRVRDLAEASVTHDRDPENAEATIWLGRRMAYLGHYRKALSIFDQGVRRHPDNPWLLRHRGHRQITLRKFDRAIADLERASRLIEGKPDEIEPDGLPNARNIPTSTLHTNVWYHLGLAYYLTGDLDNAARCYRKCIEFSKNPDMLSAASHWLYMTLRRSGRGDEARRVLEPIHAEMDIIENVAYHRLLLMYRGELLPEALISEALRGGSIELATVGYGVGNWYLYNGDRGRGAAILGQIVDGAQWAAFGHIAAEADLLRITDREL